MKELVDCNRPVFVEGFIHQLARKIASECACASAHKYMRRNPRPRDRDGYAVWNIMATERTTRVPRVLWHDSDAPFDYCRAAALYNLDYGIEDFIDVNQGCGLGEV